MKRTHGLDEREMELVKLLMADRQTTGDIQAKLKKLFVLVTLLAVEIRVENRLAVYIHSTDIGAAALCHIVKLTARPVSLGFGQRLAAVYFVDEFGSMDFRCAVIGDAHTDSAVVSYKRAIFIDGLFN